MNPLFGIAASVLGLFGIMLGAFGAHALKASLSSEMLAVFETGVRYQMYHALALLALSVRPFSPSLNRTAGFWLAGTLIFSGSLYVLALSGVRLWGAVTPVGGLLLILGWAQLVLVLAKSQKK